MVIVPVIKGEDLRFGSSAVLIINVPGRRIDPYTRADGMTKSSVYPIVHRPLIVLGHREVIVEQIDLRGLGHLVSLLYF